MGRQKGKRVQRTASRFTDVKTVGAPRQGIAISNSVNCEIRKCDISLRSTGTPYAPLVLSANTALLVEDNLIHEGPGGSIQTNDGMLGCVFAYNYFPTAQYFSILTTHSPYPSMNLYEGNLAANLQSDSYHGNEGQLGLFRNWLTGVTHNVHPYPTQLGAATYINRMVRDWFAVGNIMLAPGYTWGSEHTAAHGLVAGNTYGGGNVGTATPSAGDWWLAWDSTASAVKSFTVTLTARTDDYNGTVAAASTEDADQIEALAAEAGFPRCIGAFGNLFCWFGTRSGNSWPVSTDKTAHPNVSGFALSALSSTTLVHPNPGNFKEFDNDVHNTGTRKETTITRQEPWNPLAATRCRIHSCTRANPRFSGSLSWPPFDPASPRFR